MAKGKQAAMAANRRHKAALEHNDRLGDKIAELKIRARDNEKAAVLVPVLQAKIAELERQLAEDDVAKELVEMMDTLTEYRKSWQDLSKERWDAVYHLMDELLDRWIDPHATRRDQVEYLIRKYPLLFSWRNRGGYPNSEQEAIACNRDLIVRAGEPRYLSDAAVRRIQVAHGRRSGLDLEEVRAGDGEPFKDVAQFLIEMNEIVDANLTTDEAYEYLGVKHRRY